MFIENEYSLGDTVYLKTDEEQIERLVIGIQVNPSGLIYVLSHGEEETCHYDIEISRE